MPNTPDPNERPFLVYDCFSDVRYGGNVGGIVLDAQNLSDDEMQSIAGEINASVTGFVTAINERAVSARFFMPGGEIAMCGHVTVGLFSYLTESVGHEPGRFTLQTQAGSVPVDVTRNGNAPSQVMMRVGLPKIKLPALDPTDLANALGLPGYDLGKVNPIESAEAGLTHLFVQFDTLDEVQQLQPDFQMLTEISKSAGVHTIACFTMQTELPDSTLHIRDFCPAVGANEVPASGTTNGALAGYLVRHSLVSSGDQTVLAEQGKELGRPSLVFTKLSSESAVLTEVWVGGHAVPSLRGHVIG